VGEGELPTNTKTQVIHESQSKERVQYRGIIPAPGDGVLGGYESGGEYSPKKQSIRRDIGQKIADGELSLNDVPYLFLYLINFGSRIAGVITIGMLVWVGILFLSTGVTDSKENAKNALSYAIIGLIVTFSAWLIPGVIQIQLSSGFGVGDGYTLEESYRDSLLGISETLSEEDRNFPLEYPSHLPGAGEDRLKGNVTDITSLMQNLMGAMTLLVSTVAIFFLVNNGMKMILATGDTDTIEKIKKSLRWIFGGILLIIFSYVIVKTVISLPYAGQTYSIPQ